MIHFEHAHVALGAVMRAWRFELPALHAVELSVYLLEVDLAAVAVIA